MKNSGLILLIVAVIVVVVGIGAVIMNNNKSSNNDNTNTPDTTSGKLIVTNVAIKSMAFSPSIVTIKAGSVVTWENTDVVLHNVIANNGEFSSDNLAKGETFSFTFETPGTYTYKCTLHPGMVGTIVVE